MSSGVGWPGFESWLCDLGHSLLYACFLTFKKEIIMIVHALQGIIGAVHEVRCGWHLAQDWYSKRSIHVSEGFLAVMFCATWTISSECRTSRALLLVPVMALCPLRLASYFLE